MRVLIAGASGFVGRHLVSHFKNKGVAIHTLTRDLKKTDSTTFYWQPSEYRIDHESLKNVDVIINLAGEGIAAKYWTEAQKKEIYQSRLNSTKCLIDALNATKDHPKLLINASAIGIYEESEDKFLNEDSDLGDDFLATVCRAWEGEVVKLLATNTRIVITRFGIILGKDGGVLKKLLLPFKLCLGGKLGNGKQFMSWISINDVVRAIDFIIQNDKISGVINLTSPKPTTNEKFTKYLSSTIKRPTIFHIPESILKYALGEMAEELLLKSAPIVPRNLLENQFTFKNDDLEKFLKEELTLG